MDKKQVLYLFGTLLIGGFLGYNLAVQFMEPKIIDLSEELVIIKQENDNLRRDYIILLNSHEILVEDFQEYSDIIAVLSGDYEIYIDDIVDYYLEIRRERDILKIERAILRDQLEELSSSYKELLNDYNELLKKTE